MAGIVTAFLTFAVALTPAIDASSLRVGLLVTGIATAVFGVLTKILDLVVVHSRKEDIKALRAQFYEVFDGPMNRMIAQVQRMALRAPAKRQESLHALRLNVVISTAQLVASKTARATYFMLEDRTALVGRRAMRGTEYNYSDNRRDNATTEFVEADDPQSEIWQALDGHGPVIYPNLTVSAPAGWDANAHVYKGFLTFRIEMGDAGVGVLTVNSLNPNEFEPADVAIVGALAAVLSMAEAAAHGYRPAPTRKR
ncbi:MULTISPECIES: hypothetical protein [unclassified Microbacterium]|uniref:hypothetical protein n=1 Tax=unclassified Microbacterium TaxID=2609290 RepID=UPI0016055173|nr:MULTISPECIES: hypothetical protein [unclassified Microbacterium]QNA92703.1 hypothetical protein G4G29_10525 [Microbacterium sp. Se63.02b]QYM62837.1 hypothetical protein K1X59_10560 [Microbacterium sp. Se5.02b]